MVHLPLLEGLIKKIIEVLRISYCFCNAYSYKEDNSKLQYFMTAQCTNNSSGVDQLVQVQTVRVTSYSESSFIDAPKHQRVPLDQNHTTEAEYRLNARVKDRIWNTVKFYGIWEIN